MASPSYDALDRAQSAIDEYGLRTDFENFGELLTDLAHYAATKGWDFADEALISRGIAERAYARAS